MSWTENKWLKPAWLGENNDFVNKYQDKFAKIGEKFAPEINTKTNSPLKSAGISDPDIKESTNGANPVTAVHELGATYYSKEGFEDIDSKVTSKGFVFSFNNKSKEYNLKTTILIIYTPLFFGDPDKSRRVDGPLEKENPGLFREVEGHEKYGHVPQIMEVVRKALIIKLQMPEKSTRHLQDKDERKKGITYKGDIATILTEYGIDLRKILDEEISFIIETNPNITEDNVAELVEVNNILEQSELLATQQILINKLCDKIKVAMSASNIHRDANERAKRKLGGEGSIKYLNFKKDITWQGNKLPQVYY